MKLAHTLLFLVRENHRYEDMAMMESCLHSLETSAYQTVVVYNQGCLSNEEATRYLSRFALHVHVLGEAANAGTTIGRQRCFEYIWNDMPDVQFISEIHPDMIFPANWEEPLITYLETHDEPMISCGIIDKAGKLPFIEKSFPLPNTLSEYPAYLCGLSENTIVHGFSVPCIHVSSILKETGGYNPAFLRGKQCFEDDSMLLGYYYYYGTRRQWRPMVNFNSVVYHAVAGQRMDVSDNVAINFNGLIRQYGALGLKHLSELHRSAWQKNYFKRQYDAMIKQ